MYQICRRKVTAKKPLTRVDGVRCYRYWCRWFYIGTWTCFLDEDALPVLLSALLFSSSHNKLDCKSVQTWCKSVDLFFSSTSHPQHGTQLLRRRMMWEAEAESKTGAQSWQRLSQGENGFLRDRLLQASQGIWSPFIMLQGTVSKEEWSV